MSSDTGITQQTLCRLLVSYNLVMHDYIIMLNQ